MGIDRHELEHRNWRSAKQPERAPDVAPEDVTIVPDDVRVTAPKTPRKSAGKVKRDA